MSRAGGEVAISGLAINVDAKTADPLNGMPAPLSTPSGKSEERRRSQRRPHIVEAFLSSPTGGNRLEGTAIDLSKHGIALDVNRPIATGTFQRLEMGAGPQKTVREVRILSCRQESNGTFRIHATFS